MDYQFQMVKSLGRGPNKPLLELLDKQDEMERPINGHFREERISSKSSCSSRSGTVYLLY